MSNNELGDCQRKLVQIKQEFEEFVYLVSHDLKAPIRAINNLTEWVEEDLGPDIPTEVKHNLHLLRARSLRLDKMLGAILELSRVARMNLELETISLTPFLNQVKESFANRGATFSIPENLPTLTTYSSKLQTVLEQLFDNAIRHNPGKNIHITVMNKSDVQYVRLLIADNGAGILPEGLDRIFQIFYTGQGQEESCVGAGLTLVKKIVDFVGGNIEVKENSLAGSTFILHWPLKIIQKP